jgi:ubiquinone/menaquinone biosynthesis C-methylase UbiE
MAEWVSYFDTDHPIYVNARHREVHNTLIANGILGYVPRRDAVVLDYGCGEAFHADRVAEATGRLILCDAGPNRLAELSRRFTGNSKVEVRSPVEAAHLADHSIDLIVLHSVAQYLTPAEADALFALFRRVLKPDGLLLVGDIIPPEASALTSARTLIGLAAKNGFLLAAIGGLVRTLLSGYLSLRSKLGLSRYTASEMIEKLRRTGFAAQRAPQNMGHDQIRMTFLARPA